MSQGTGALAKSTEVDLVDQDGMMADSESSDLEEEQLTLTSTQPTHTATDTHVSVLSCSVHQKHNFVISGGVEEGVLYARTPGGLPSLRLWPHHQTTK